ncbi:hypothetical protein CMQ_3785 [Grosmannia clavigera kw1407]|uniref:Uncharacterized protein n=1 Tax=Grosmannia clavigera (strain kw1407 / UAMH 11150) TaxID=655863 RepID=F0X8D4_GROCL|nr:uncharacterized protein CMQ_3785 [Grosmannia clavigera kw1407]EFX05716.1 hypothetical protein CMQ_3785 [Grosmannia clavigera kw1407]
MAPRVLVRLSGPAALLILCLLTDCAAAGVLTPQKVRRVRKAGTPWPTQIHVDATVMSSPSAHSSPLPAPAAVPPPASTTVPHRLLSVVPWPRPTDGPAATAADFAGTALNELLRRDLNTICGYIGGNPDLPATCSVGSHCVLDTEHSAVGCCPDNAASCTSGVYTGCLDGDSSTQNEVNPYVYTCSASSVCYKNEFSGGYYQYGCGSASDMGTTVAMSATGMSSLLDLSSLQVSFTETIQSSTSAPSASTKATAHSSASSASSASSSYSSSSTSPTSLSTPTTSSKLPNSSDRDRAGIIIGATISSVAGLIAILALLVFCFWKRRGGSRRKGQNLRHSPASGNFQALHGTAEDFETGLRPEMAQAEPLTPKRRTSYGRWPFSEDVDEDEAWVTPAIGPAAAAAIAAAAAKHGRGAGASEPRQRPESSYRGVKTSAASTPRPKAPATSPPMTGMPTPPPAAAYFQMSPYGGVVHESEEQLPLTYDRTDFTTRSGQQATLSRIGEESDDSINGSGGGGDGNGDINGDINTRSGGSRTNRARKLSFDDDPEELQVKSRIRGGGESGTNSTGSGVGAISTAGNPTVDLDGGLTKGDSGLAEMPGTPIIRADEHGGGCPLLCFAYDNGGEQAMRQSQFSPLSSTFYDCTREDYVHSKSGRTKNIWDAWDGTGRRMAAMFLGIRGAISLPSLLQVVGSKK